MSVKDILEARALNGQPAHARAGRRHVARHALQPEAPAAVARLAHEVAARDLGSVAAPARALARLVAVGGAVEAEAAASRARPRVRARRLRHPAVQARVQQREVVIELALIILTRRLLIQRLLVVGGPADDEREGGIRWGSEV